MTELTQERKVQIATELEQSIERFLDKQWVISDHASMIAKNKEEEDYLNQVNYSFVVYSG